MRFRFETEDGILYEINHPAICVGAKFVFDRPILIDVEDVLILEDGQWYLEAEEPIRLQGRWIDERASNSSKNIKVSKKPRIRNR
jgi:hypothetical protein